MNTSEKRIDYIDFDMVPDLVRSGAIFNCYIINYNISDMVIDYPIDKIIQYIDKRSYGDIDFEEYLEFVQDRGREHGANEFLAKDENFLGFLIIETEDTILVQAMWVPEMSDTIWDCFNALAILADTPKQKVRDSNSLKPTSLEPVSSITNFFKFIPLS